MKLLFSIISLCLLSLIVNAQDYFTLYGRITDQNGIAIPEINVKVLELNNVGVNTDNAGSYKLKLPVNKELTIVFSHIQYSDKTFVIKGKPGETIRNNFTLNENINNIPIINVEAKTERQTNLQRIDPKIIQLIPDISGGIEASLKAFPGVAKNNELSSQYSVRGGNFDENLVYVNDIEVYRPFLIRSGQQEGLSFVNPDMVSSILFSAGGFDAKYGDKMASVLDIRYKKPSKAAAAVSASLLGGSVSFEGCSKNHRFTHISGLRYKSSQYVLNSLDTKGDYKPSFADFQTYLTYDITEKFEISFLGNYAMNSFHFVPQTRETSFGTIDEALKLKIYFDGQERDKNSTMFGAFTTNYKYNSNLKLNLTCSAYSSYEEETLDIMGQYFLNELDKEMGSDNLGDSLMNIGIGTFLNHARNKLTANVLNFQHRGSYEKNDNSILWGANFQNEFIQDRIHEWEMLDSAGYSLPYTDSVVSMYSFVSSRNTLNTYRVTSFIQRTSIFESDSNEYSFTIGIRENYWNFSNQLLISPRVSFSARPNWKNDFLFRFSAGYYYQPPFYRELRDLNGQINYNIEAQKSLQFVLGTDYIFIAWGRPFKFLSEIYYKNFTKLIPYQIDNVRIRYLAKNNAKGYATGIDLKVNGEFVPGVESWASISIMKTMEDLSDDFYINSDSLIVAPGYIPRPSDQLVNFGLFFQDYLPRNPSYKMQLSLLFGSGLPFGPPKSERFQATYRMPAYRRVDIGFSKLLKSEEHELPKGNPFKHFKSIWLGLEVFNLLNINNTISYQWVSDVRDHQYAVPNYLSSRRLNLKLIAKF
ncbi:MAG: carboxypeptidase-like regulatory domain-containing protein [Bacteroidia bacterium]|nr:carboxypeptidase-like regulatory domain-containing protein [Bacteroidia bacterium]